MGFVDGFSYFRTTCVPTLTAGQKMLYAPDLEKGPPIRHKC